MPTLTGTEVLEVLGQQPNGQPAATTFLASTQDIANLATAGGSPFAKYTTGTTTGTFLAGQITGAGVDYVVYANTNTAPGTINTRTAAQMVADLGNATLNQTYILRIVNAQGTGTLTVGAGTNVTLSGTMTLAANTTRDFIVTVTSVATPAITIQSIGTAVFS